MGTSGVGKGEQRVVLGTKRGGRWGWDPGIHQILNYEHNFSNTKEKAFPHVTTKYFLPVEKQVKKSSPMITGGWKF